MSIMFCFLLLILEVAANLKGEWFAATRLLFIKFLVADVLGTLTLVVFAQHRV
jgi:hypothetical protein